MGVPPGVGERVHVVLGGGDQLEVLFLVGATERSSPSVAVLGRRGPPPSSLLVVALAAASAAAVVAKADLHFGRLVGRGGKVRIITFRSRSADAAAAVGRAVQAARQRIEKQDHRHAWMVNWLLWTRRKKVVDLCFPRHQKLTDFGCWVCESGIESK